MERIRVRGHVSSHPKRLVGRWTVFLTAESTGWIIADPHPPHWPDRLGKGPFFTSTRVTPPSLFSLWINFPHWGGNGSQHGYPQRGAAVTFG